MSEKHKTDVAIIGAGPVGLFAVFQCGMLGLRNHVIEALPEIGGQCSALYPEKPIYDIPGCPEILAGKLIENLEKQAAPFSPVYHTGEQASSLEPLKNGWKIAGAKNTEITAKAVIIAGGSGAFGPNRPPIDGIGEYEGRSVFYMVRDKCYLEGKRVVIAGGGDSAVDWAVNLCGVADKIYVVHRREKFRAAPESVARMEYMARQGLIELVIPYQLKSIEGQKGNLKKVIVCSPEGDEREIEADALLAFYGLASQTGPIERWGLELEDGRIVIDQASGETNLKGVYAAGDIATYPHKHKLILTGFAETVQAARSAFHLIYPEEELQPEHSTSRGNPGLA